MKKPQHLPKPISWHKRILRSERSWLRFVKIRLWRACREVFGLLRKPVTEFSCRRLSKISNRNLEKFKVPHALVPVHSQPARPTNFCRKTSLWNLPITYGHTFLSSWSLCKQHLGFFPAVHFPDIVLQSRIHIRFPRCIFQAEQSSGLHLQQHWKKNCFFGPPMKLRSIITSKGAAKPFQILSARLLAYKPCRIWYRARTASNCTQTIFWSIIVIFPIFLVFKLIIF